MKDLQELKDSFKSYLVRAGNTPEVIDLADAALDLAHSLGKQAGALVAKDITLNLVKKTLDELETKSGSM